MSEWDNPVFDEVAERMEGEARQKVNRGKDLLMDPQRIDSIKTLRNYLCDIAVPQKHKGMPRVNSCKTCQSQCGYGRRLIELVSANVQLAAEKKAEKREQTAELPAAVMDQMSAADRGDKTMCVVHMTASQCCNVAEFIELNLLRVIREDDEIDNLMWVEDMIGAMNVLKNAGGASSMTDTLNQYRDRIYADAVAHGLWEHGGGNLAYLAAAKLILSEALELLEEAYRLDVYLRMGGLSSEEGSYRWHAFMMELADVMISCLSCCGEMGINADMIVSEKMDINHKRSWKHEND